MAFWYRLYGKLEPEPEELEVIWRGSGPADCEDDTWLANDDEDDAGATPDVSEDFWTSEPQDVETRVNSRIKQACRVVEGIVKLFATIM